METRRTARQPWERLLVRLADYCLVHRVGPPRAVPTGPKQFLLVFGFGAWLAWNEKSSETLVRVSRPNRSTHAAHERGGLLRVFFVRRSALSLARLLPHASPSLSRPSLPHAVAAPTSRRCCSDLALSPTSPVDATVACEEPAVARPAAGR